MPTAYLLAGFKKTKEMLIKKTLRDFSNPLDIPDHA